MEELYKIYRLALSKTSLDFQRYMHRTIDWKTRLLVLVGGRGMGKTTLLLQHILLEKAEATSLYIDAAHTYFASHSLYDTARTFSENGGRTLYIDEVHKYPSWSAEIKMIHDYLSDLQVVVTGSSILDIRKGTDADLSRRAICYTMEGMSFREYLNFTLRVDVPVHTLEQVVAGEVELPKQIAHPLPLFKQYLREGYYPFFESNLFLSRLDNVINQTLEMDIPFYAQLSVAASVKLKKLMYIIAHSVPFKPNISEIGRAVGIDRQTVGNYLLYMEKAGLLRSLHNRVPGMRLLEKVEKIYLANTALIYAQGGSNPDTGNLRETFFLASLAVGGHLVSAAQAGDFQVDDYVFEVGGRSKTGKQIQQVENSYVVKDDIERKGWRELPLWAFGLLY